MLAEICSALLGNREMMGSEEKPLDAVFLCPLIYMLVVLYYKTVCCFWKSAKPFKALKEKKNSTCITMLVTEAGF